MPQNQTPELMFQAIVDKAAKSACGPNCGCAQDFIQTAEDMRDAGKLQPYFDGVMSFDGVMEAVGHEFAGLGDSADEAPSLFDAILGVVFGGIVGMFAPPSRGEVIGGAEMLPDDVKAMFKRENGINLDDLPEGSKVEVFEGGSARVSVARLAPKKMSAAAAPDLCASAMADAFA